MTHGISDQERMLYIEDALAAEERSRVERHLLECAECRAAFDEVRTWRDALAHEGAVLRGSVELPRADLERMLVESLVRIQAVRPSRQGSAREALMALQTLVEPILGRGMVEASVAMALRRLGIGSEGVPAPRWREFVNALSDSISAISGMAAASLVNIAGLSLGDNLRAEGGQA